MIEIVAILILISLIAMIFEIKRAITFNKKALQMILTLYNKYKSDFK